MILANRPFSISRVLLLAALGVAGCSKGGPPPRAEAVTARPAAHPVEPAPPVTPMPRPTGLLPEGTSCIGSGCHADFGTASYVHGALRTADNCSVCHGADEGGHVYPLKRSGNATCTFCHDTVTGQRVHQHGGAQVACIACHDPHVAKHRPLLRAPVSQVCATCHPAEHPAVPHGPFAAGDCAACHDPHESDFAGLLRGGEGSEHCFKCHEQVHDAITTSSRVHAPVTQGCTFCHEPHGSDHPFSMRRPVAETCYACHADIEALVGGAQAPHGALAREGQCGNCHDAHASSHPGLLKERQDVLCLQCHGEEIEATDGRTIPSMTASVRDREFLHGPVRSGHCTACHNVHGASNSRLLTRHFDEAFYASFDVRHYALCFECHASELVTAERTRTLTDFRDGDVNLHYLHVNRQRKGRTCRTCHEMHGSDNPAHVAESVPFEGSGWALPIGFEQTDTGGSCAPGCHKPMSYRRGDSAPLPPGGEVSADRKEDMP